MFFTVSSHFSPPINCLQYIGALYGVCMLCVGRFKTQLFWKKRSERLFVSSDLLLLAVFCLSNLTAMLPFSQFSTAISMLTALLSLLTAYLPSSHGLAVHVFLLKLTLILPKSLMQEWTSTFSLSSPLLVNSGIAFLPLYLFLSSTSVPPRGGSIKTLLQPKLIFLYDWLNLRNSV